MHQMGEQKFSLMIYFVYVLNLSWRRATFLGATKHQPSIFVKK